MKKSISILLILSVFIACVVGSALADGFSFHKGLVFGISLDEAVQFEQETNNTKFKETTIGSARYGRDGISGNTTFANEEVEIYLYFDDETKLSSVVFVQDATESRDFYDTVNEALENKYNKIADINSYTQYPIIGDDAVSLYQSYNFGYTLVKYFGDAKIEEFSQYLEEDESGYYNIEILLWKQPSLPIYGTLISYSYISKEHIAQVIDEQAKEEQEKQQATSDDI